MDIQSVTVYESREAWMCHRTGQAVGCDVCLTAKDVYDYYEEMEK